MKRPRIAMGVVAFAGLTAALFSEYQALSRLRAANRALQARVGDLGLVAQDNQRLSNLLAQASRAAPLPREEFNDLLRLRGEVGLGRRLVKENQKLRTQNAKLREAAKEVNAPVPVEPEAPAEAEFQKDTLRREQDLKQWALSFHLYASQADGRSPDTWEQVADQVPSANRGAFLDFATNNFEIVYHGLLSAPECSGKILFREKQARRSPNGEWVKTYGLADGEVQTHAQSDGDFASWEAHH